MANGTKLVETTDYKLLYEEALKAAEKAKQEAQDAKALAQEQLNKTATAQTDNEETANSVEEWLEQRVPIMLFKDGEKYKDDVDLAIGPERIRIKRGIQVYIKRKFAMVLENKYRQQMVAADLQEQLAGEFSASLRERGFQI